eukprot:TRINITY_DN17069_c0_g1_i1.p1 TRINITY_DN17069_c0_g1~~TRINITY_DN17069_c0_g1_i1.p1  ORF type:complete len:888 (+),score=164.55 TRINITY_DN17069_c0_g1_i1:173-2665(+)
MTFGGRNNGGFFVHEGAGRGQTSIWWSGQVPEVAMPNYSDDWNIPNEADLEQSGLDPASQPPGAYPGINRKWVGFKPSRVRGGYYGSGVATRDTWGPDLQRSESGDVPKPETVIDRVSVDWFMDEFSVPLNKQNTVMSACRHTATESLRVNLPQRQNQIDNNTVRTLYRAVRIGTHSPTRRVTMIGACQNGHTDWWCKGLPLHQMASRLRYLVSPPPTDESTAGVERLAEVLMARRVKPAGGHLEQVEAATRVGHPQLMHIAHQRAQWLKRREMAERKHEIGPPSVLLYVNREVREAMRLLWVLGNGDTPTLSFVNGKCKNIGSGLALLCNYAAVRDEASFTFSGARDGLSPIGGLLRLLTSEASQLKYPGLAEYMVLTNDKLYGGDAKRLGWTSIHAPTDTHLNERMVQDYLNIHPTHDAGDGHRFMHALLFSDHDQAPDMDKCSISFERMEWIRWCFDKAESVVDVKDRLSRLADDASKGLVPAAEKRDGDRVTAEQWAAAVSHAVDRGSPFALAVSFEMVRKAKKESLNLPDCMALEYRCFVRMMQRPDFITAQTKGPNSWSPETVMHVNPSEVEELISKPLCWLSDGAEELWLPFEGKDWMCAGEAMKSLGMEVVEGLGTDPSVATPDRAEVPRGVNVYRDARHPTSGAVTSEREPEAPPWQIEYRKRREAEAHARLSAGHSRVHRIGDSAMDEAASSSPEAFVETERERTERAARSRWDMMRLAAEKATGGDRARLRNRGVEQGGERVLSLEPNEHEEPFAPRTEPVYGKISRHPSANILTHFYDGEGTPRLVNNWGNLLDRADQERAAGRSEEDIARLLLTNSF